MTVLNLLLYSLADNILFVCFCSSNLTVWLWILYLWQQNSKQSYAAHWRCVQYFIFRMKKKMPFDWFNLWARTFWGIMLKVLALKSGISGSNPNSTIFKCSDIGQVSEHVSSPVKNMHLTGCSEDWKWEWQDVEWLTKLGKMADVF